MKINPKIQFYKTVECPICDDGRVIIKLTEISNKNCRCFYCNGKGWLYIHLKDSYENN